MSKGGGWRRQRMRAMRRNLARAYPEEGRRYHDDARRTLLIARLTRYFVAAACVAFIAGLALVQCAVLRR